MLAEADDLPGQAYISWKKELSVSESKVRDWTFGQKDLERNASPHGARPARRRNRAWSRDELFLAFDLYLRHRGFPPGKNSAEVLLLSERLLALAKSAGIDAPSETFRNELQADRPAIYE
jgi:hypothetical protein